MNLVLEDSLRNALAGMTGGPAPLVDAIRFYASQSRGNAGNVETELATRVSVGPNDQVRKLLNETLGRWDWEANAPWTGATEANTRERRARIYELLRLSTKLCKALNEHVPPFEGAKAIVIDDPKSVRDWYTFEFRRKHNFYWGKLRTYLEQARKLPNDALNSIESSADRILERLDDPASPEIFRSRGLVVGYVQSGKTTNFTAVIAKAIDAGYRLIIVLSGTTNLLRNQTQRRLDMELVGVENILRGASANEAHHDYVDDERWPKDFISYGKQPALLGQVDIHRLTSQKDFGSRHAGLNPLEFDFEKRDRNRPLFDRENLDHAGARLAVVKKQRDRLAGLIRELHDVGKSKCADVPTLVIDDESDQASVNTVNPKKVTDKARNRINEQIVKILALLPRAQYVAYTATPFANVFVDPNDPDDIYPKDFLISLERPQGYMGAREFLDFDGPEAGKLSNKDAYIRDIPKKESPKEDQLQEAMDAFVLSGALKKYRQKYGNAEFKHHTMLFHHSFLKDDQEKVVRRIETLWMKAGYGSPGAAAARLKSLLEKDFRKVWSDRGRSEKLRMPKSYAELVPSIGAALDEIRRGKSPVLMVNSADDADVPDFDAKSGVWKIIVGGAKLSRGYTIEGLTVSYFRRRTTMQDTLMQMGRWFGYRPRYSDLVRLYIGRSEPAGKSTIDLYGAFEMMCRDEENFRGQLAMYERLGGITPKKVPALVYNSHPKLRPTSKNKMYHAKIVSAAFDYREPTSQASSGNGRKQNEKVFKGLLSSLDIRQTEVKISVGGKKRFLVKWATAPHADVLSLLTKVEWEKGDNPISAEIGFLKREKTLISSWFLVAPQVDGEAGTWKVGDVVYKCVARSKVEGTSRFGVFSDPTHLNFAKWLVGGSDKGFASVLKPGERIGVLLFYPTRELLRDKTVDSGIPVMGFGLALPNSAQSKPIIYSV